MNSNPYFILYTKINSKLIKDLNIRAKALGRKHRYKSSRPWIRQQFLKYDQKHKQGKEKTSKLDFIKIENFCVLKDTTRK